MSGMRTDSPFYLRRRETGSAFAKSVESLIASGTGAQQQALRLMAENPDEFLRKVWVPQISKLQFQIDNVPFQARYEPEDDGIKLHIWAVLGYLPYSVESHRRRRALVSILDWAFALKNAKFGLNRESQIVVSYTEKVPDIRPPAFIFVPLVRFLQEARPFIKLIGEAI